MVSVGPMRRHWFRRCKSAFFSPERELEGVFNVIDSKSLVYFELAFLRILQFRAWKGDQGMANGRWAVDGPKEAGLLPPD